MHTGGVAERLKAAVPKTADAKASLGSNPSPTAKPKPKGEEVASNPRYANGNARRKLRAWLKAQQQPCHICGMAIDYSLPAGNPMSFEVDEIVPVSKGGSPLDRANVAAAHRVCNERRGNKSVEVCKRTASAQPCPTSVDW